MWMGLLVLCGVGAAALGQEIVVHGGPGTTSYSYPYQGTWPGQPSTELTIEQQRKLGLSEEQIQKIAEKRRDIEKERAALDTQLRAAQQAAAAANAEVARLNQEVQTLLSVRLVKVYESLMNETQLNAWRQQRCLEQAKQWLASYKPWLKLSDAQVDDIAALLVPVFEKYSKMEDQKTAAREGLAELRRAEKPDVAAIEKAEKELAELSRQNVYQLRQDELFDKMRAGLLPDQLEKLDKMYRRK
jgi:chromosome segregation ATPase